MSRHLGFRKGRRVEAVAGGWDFHRPVSPIADLCALYRTLRCSTRIWEVEFECCTTSVKYEVYSALYGGCRILSVSCVGPRTGQVVSLGKPQFLVQARSLQVRPPGQ